MFPLELMNANEPELKFWIFDVPVELLRCPEAVISVSIFTPPSATNALAYIVPLELIIPLEVKDPFRVI